MRHLLFVLAALLLCSAPLHAQTLKSLMYNSTNGQVVANTGTNTLTFTNETRFGGGDIILQSPSISWAGTASGVNLEELYLYFDGQEKLRWREEDIEASVPLSFSGTNTAPTTRANLGFSTNLNTLWTATNASNARSAVGLGETNTPTFRRLVVDPNESGALGVQYGNNDSGIYNGATYNILSLRVGGINALTADTNGVTFANSATTRTNLGLPLAALTNTSNVTMMRALSGSTSTNEPYSGSISVVGTNNTNTLVFSNGILQSVQ